jgi:hypothetical protein
MHMKKKIVRKTIKKAATKKTTSVKRSVAPVAKSQWGEDRGMVIMLAAGTIVLVVIGMYMAGWL